MTRAIHSLQEAQVALEEFIPPTAPLAPYTLTRMRQLMDFLGNPQDRLRIIHVAGTSGKTSTCYYAAALLHAVGHSVGLTVSPHIDKVSERAQINLQTLPDAEYCAELSLFLGLVDDSGIKPSYFEVLVAFAYWLFDKKRVDYAVIEVGLGGLLDGTNVVNRPDKVCIITDIGLDHVEVLGTTLSEIAAQKAGIISPYNPVFMLEQSEAVVSVIRSVADQNHSPLQVLARTPPSQTNQDPPLPLFQQNNFTLSEAAIHFIATRDGWTPPDARALAQARTTYIPARMEAVSFHGKTIILDGSHNEQKLRALVASLRQQYPEATFTLLVSFGTNKTSGVITSLKVLRSLADKIILTEFATGQDTPRRAIPAAELTDYAREAKFSSVIVADGPKQGLELLTQAAGTIGLVTGSFYLLNHLRPLLFEKK